MTDGLEDPDLDVEIELRTPVELADRLVILASVCRRAFLEMQTTDAPEDDAEGERFDLLAWLRTENLDAAVSPVERQLLTTRVGRLAADEAEAASWQAEGLAVLGWAAVMVTAVPPYDIPADPAAALALIPAPWDTTTAFRRSVHLRSEDDVARERERAELWHWRASTAELAPRLSRRDQDGLRDAVRDVAVEALLAGLILDIRDDDFAVGGRPYRDLPSDTVETLGEIAFQRHRALNWLCGLGDDWDKVPTDL